MSAGFATIAIAAGGLAGVGIYQLEQLIRRKTRYMRGQCVYCRVRAGDPHLYGCEGWRGQQNAQKDDAA